MTDATMYEGRQKAPRVGQLLQTLCEELCQGRPTHELTDEKGQKVEVGRGTAGNI